MLWQNLLCYAKAHCMGGIIKYVISDRPDELWNACTQRLAGGADAAVVNECGKLGQQGAKGRVVTMNHAFG